MTAAGGSVAASVAGRADAEAERLRRALAPSGRRLAEAAETGAWVVLAGGDRRRRPVLRMGDAVVLALAARGELIAADGGGYVLASALRYGGPDPDPADVAATLGRAADAARARASGVGFAKLARQAMRGEGPLSVREALAGRRLIADAEAARRAPGLTMDWTAGPADRARRGGGAPTHATAARARAKLEGLRARIGEAAFRLLVAACIDGQPLAKLESRFGLSKRSAGRRLSDALARTADAYDGL